MKTLITFAFFAVTFSATAQLPVDQETGKFTYTEVVEQPGTQQELLSRAREWYARAYASANDVIQLDDKEAGKIIGKGVFPIYLSMNNRYVRHTVTIEVKDGRYRYTISNFVLDWGNGVAVEPFETLQKMYQKKAYTTAAETVPSIVESLKKAMATQKQEW